MIDFDARYINNAHRISDVKLASSVTTLYDGQWLKMQDDGTMVLHAGTSATKAYLTISSKYGDPVDNIGRVITAGPAGRDNVTSTGRVSVLIGPYRIATDQYETGTYHAGNPLKVSENSKLALWVDGTDHVEDIVAHVFTPPASADDTMVIVHE